MVVSRTAIGMRISMPGLVTPGDLTLHERACSSKTRQEAGILKPMRRIVMFNWLTADGYFAGPDGNLNWVVPDEEQAKAAAAGISGVDTFLFGRRTYELFEGFWRHALGDSSTVPDPHDPGRRSPEHRSIAIALNEMTKVVFSRTLKDVTWKNSRLLHELDPREVETMKRQPGKDMIVFGSGSIVSQLTSVKENSWHASAVANS